MPSEEIVLLQQFTIWAWQIEKQWPTCLDFLVGPVPACRSRPRGTTPSPSTPRVPCLISESENIWFIVFRSIACKSSVIYWSLLPCYLLSSVPCQLRVSVIQFFHLVSVIYMIRQSFEQQHRDYKVHVGFNS